MRPFEERDRNALRALLVEYFEGIAARLQGIGGPMLDPVEAAETSLASLKDCLPPYGLTLVVDGADGLVATGTLRRLSPTAGEMKRMCVRPAAQGEGIGRALVEARLEWARAAGITDIYADTVRGNDRMLGLYGRLGFQQVKRYPGNYNDPALDPFLTYLHKSLA